MWDKRAILTAIKLNFGLDIILVRNDGQNKFELDISNIVPIMGMRPPEMAQMDAHRHGRNSVILSRISINLVAK